MTPPLFIRTRGRAGPLVLLLHGLGASGRLWRSVADQLPADVRLVCPDLLGFGRSPRPRIAYSLADHLAALDTVLARVNPGGAPVILGGTSLGAVLALEWAAGRPDRFSGVALIALPAYRTAAEARSCIAALSPLAWATVNRPDLGELICGVMCAGRPLWRALLPLLTPGVPAAEAATSSSTIGCPTTARSATSCSTTASSPRPSVSLRQGCRSGCCTGMPTGQRRWRRHGSLRTTAAGR